MLGFHRHQPGRCMHPEELSVARFLLQFRGRVDLGTTLDHSRASPNLIPCQLKLRCFRRGQTPAVGTQELNRSGERAKHGPRCCSPPRQAKSLLQQRKPRGKTFLLQPCLTRSFEQISVWACVIGRACSSCFLRLYLKRPEQKYYGKFTGERESI